MNKYSILKSLMVQVTGMIILLLIFFQPTLKTNMPIFGLEVCLSILIVLELAIIFTKGGKRYLLFFYSLTIFAKTLLLFHWIDMVKATSGHIFLVIPIINLTLFLLFVLPRDEKEKILKEIES